LCLANICCFSAASYYLRFVSGPNLFDTLPRSRSRSQSLVALMMPRLYSGLFVFTCIQCIWMSEHFCCLHVATIDRQLPQRAFAAFYVPLSLPLVCRQFICNLVTRIFCTLYFHVPVITMQIKTDVFPILFCPTMSSGVSYMLPPAVFCKCELFMLLQFCGIIFIPHSFKESEYTKSSHFWSLKLKWLILNDVT
jgi:hypothetical protein